MSINLQALTGSGYGEIDFTWDTPSETDDQSFPNFSMQIKRSLNPITSDELWDAATLVWGTPDSTTELNAITTQCPTGTWYFAMRYTIVTGSGEGIYSYLLSDSVPASPNLDTTLITSFGIATIAEVDPSFHDTGITGEWYSYGGKKYVRCQLELTLTLPFLEVPANMLARISGHGVADTDYLKASFIAGTYFSTLTMTIDTTVVADGAYSALFEVGLYTGSWVTDPARESVTKEYMYDNTVPAGTLTMTPSTVIQRDAPMTAVVAGTDALGFWVDGAYSAAYSLTEAVDLFTGGAFGSLSGGANLVGGPYGAVGSAWFMHKMRDMAGNYVPVFASLGYAITAEEGYETRYFYAVGPIEPGGSIQYVVPLLTDIDDPDLLTWEIHADISDSQLIPPEDIVYDPDANTFTINISIPLSRHCEVPKIVFIALESQGTDDNGDEITEIILRAILSVAITGYTVGAQIICNPCATYGDAPVPSPDTPLVESASAFYDADGGGHDAESLCTLPYTRFMTDENENLYLHSPDGIQVYELSKDNPGSEMFKIKIKTLDMDISHRGFKGIIERLTIKYKSAVTLVLNIFLNSGDYKGDDIIIPPISDNYGKLSTRGKLRGYNTAIQIQEEDASSGIDVEVRGIEVESR
jgi:hypothetical protein